MRTQRLAVTIAVVGGTAVAAASAFGFGYQSTIGEPGSGVGQLGFPNAIAVSRAPDDRIFVVETGNARVQRFNADGTQPFVFPTTATGGGGGQGDGQLYVPQGIAVDEAEVYVADTGNSRVQVFSFDGAFKRKWGTEGVGNDQFNNPGGIAVAHGAGGLVAVADTRNRRVQLFTKAGQYVRTVGGPGTEDGRFVVPLGVAISGDYLFVSDENQPEIQVFNVGSGDFITKFEAPNNVDEIAVDHVNQFLYAAAPLFPGQIIRYSLKTITFGIKDFTFTAADQPGSPPFNGHGIAVSGDGERVYMADGSAQDVKVFGECDAAPRPGTIAPRAVASSLMSRPIARAAAVNEVRAVAVQPSVTVHKAGTPEHQWCNVTADTVLQQGDEISVDPDGAVTLQFADNSTVVIRNTTQLKIASFFTEGGVVKTEILLKMGQVAAQIHKSEATKSDFRIKSPTGTASVRDTKFSVFYDAGARAMVESTTEGVVEVDPEKAGLKTVLVRAGREVEVTPRAISKPAKLGKAGARGGINRVAAIARVEAVLASKNQACNLTTAATSPFGAKPARKAWSVTAKVAGAVKGSSRWTVKGRSVKPANALARRIRKGCA